jgi:YgiT-type zinc finger domain-containing protein
MVNSKNNSALCPLCGGTKTGGTTTFSADIGSGVVVVRKVKAQVCDQGGESWIDPITAGKLERIVEDARLKHHQVEVLELT